MARRSLLALAPVLLLAPAAAEAQGIGGHVVEDPYAEFPRIRLDPPEPESRAAPRRAPRPAVQRTAPPIATAPTVGIPTPAGAAPISPQKALGLILQDRLIEELEALLPGLAGPPKPWRDRRQRQGRGDDDDEKWKDAWDD